MTMPKVFVDYNICPIADHSSHLGHERTAIKTIGMVPMESF